MRGWIDGLRGGDDCSFPLICSLIPPSVPALATISFVYVPICGPYAALLYLKMWESD